MYNASNFYYAFFPFIKPWKISQKRILKWYFISILLISVLFLEKLYYRLATVLYVLHLYLLSVFVCMYSKVSVPGQTFAHRFKYRQLHCCVCNSVEIYLVLCSYSRTTHTFLPMLHLQRDYYFKSKFNFVSISHYYWALYMHLCVHLQFYAPM